jgi:hypothetical protein
MCDEHVGWEVVGLEPGGPPGRDGTHFNHQQQEPFVRLLLQDRSRAVISASAGVAVDGATTAVAAAGSGVESGNCGDVREHTSVPLSSEGYGAVPVTMGGAPDARYFEPAGTPPHQPAADVNDASSAYATKPAAGGTEAAVPAAEVAGGAEAAFPPAAAAGCGSRDAPAVVDFWEAVAHVIQLCDDLKVRLKFAVRVIGTLK